MGVEQLMHLRRFNLDRGKLRGPLPEALGWHCRELTRLYIARTHLSGPIPDTLGYLVRLESLGLHANSLQGVLPDALGHLAHMSDCHLERNELSGRIPSAVIASRRVQHLFLDDNAFSSTLPTGLSYLSVLQTVSVSANLLQGALPEFGDDLVSLCAQHNQLRGALPRSLHRLSNLFLCLLQHNALAGSLPVSLATLRQLFALDLRDNDFRGAFPDSFLSCRRMRILMADSNTFSGSIPATLPTYVELLMLGSNMLEGSMPAGLTKLAQLNTLGLAGRGHAPCLEGSLPLTLSRLRDLSVAVAHAHRLKGHVPALRSTLVAVSLHRNALQLMPELQLSDRSSAVLLHHNLMSCKLPRCREQPANLSLVAVGNHLAKPGKEGYPPWVSPLERHAVFWFDSNAGAHLLTRVLAGSLFAAVNFKPRLQSIGHQRVLHRCCALSLGSDSALHALHRLLGQMAKQVLFSCSLFMLVLLPDMYLCADTLAWASACLRDSSAVRACVFFLWWRMTSHALDWLRAADANRQARRKSLPSLEWLLWIALVLIVSIPAGVNVSSTCLPPVGSRSSHLLTALNVFIGACQGVVSGAVIPWLGARVNAARKSSLIAMASFLSSCAIPGLVIVYLDAACLNRWTRWWTPCRATQRKRLFDWWQLSRSNWNILPGSATINVLRQEDVCKAYAKGQVSTAACAKSLALKLQHILLGKIMVKTFMLSVWRLYSEQVSLSELMTRLALYLQLGVLCAPPLPLLGPFLVMLVASEKLLIATLRAGESALRRDSTDVGAFKGSILLAITCSLIFQVCFAPESAAVLMMGCATAALLRSASLALELS